MGGGGTCRRLRTTPTLSINTGPVNENFVLFRKLGTNAIYGGTTHDVIALRVSSLSIPSHESTRHGPRQTPPRYLHFRRSADGRDTRSPDRVRLGCWAVAAKRFVPALPGRAQDGLQTDAIRGMLCFSFFPADGPSVLLRKPSDTKLEAAAPGLLAEPGRATPSPPTRNAPDRDTRSGALSSPGLPARTTVPWRSCRTWACTWPPPCRR